MSLTVLERLGRKIAATSAESSGVKAVVTKVARAIHYDLRHLVRVVHEQECLGWIEKLGPASLDVLEISAGAAWRGLPFRSYTEMNYPEYDICRDRVPRQFDLVIADQVFEHLLWPYRAGRNVCAMLRPGGHFLVMTPFLIRIHDVPVDCSRWTETGLRYLLAECGFELDGIRTGAWGNRSALNANLVYWARVGWRRRFPNEAPYPLSVWALARKPVEHCPSSKTGPGQ
ncbi:MAG: methyltransferase domain-containing protein [Stellaceae bacterium]